MLVRKITIFLLVALLIMPAAALARQKAPIAFAKWWQNPKISQQLGLTNQEKDQLDAMHLKMRRSLMQQQNIIGEARLNLDELFDNEPLDNQAAEREYARISKAQTAQGMAKSRFLMDTRRILGLDRFRKLKAIFQRLQQ